MSFTAMVMKGFGKSRADGSVLRHFESDANGTMKINGPLVPMKQPALSQDCATLLQIRGQPSRQALAAT